MSLQSLASQHRAAILARERQAAQYLDGSFKAAWQQVFAQLQALFAQMNAAEDAGQTVNLTWLVQANRLQNILAAIHAQIGGFSATAQATVAAQMRAANQTGQQDAQALLTYKLGEVMGSFNQPQPEAQQALAASLDIGPIARRFAQLPDDAVRRARATLTAGLAAGWNPRRIAAKLKYDLSIQYNDALRISRTEAMNAYRAGTLSIYRANSDVVTGWQWLAAAGSCPICRDMDGTIHDLSEDFDGLHPNDRCTCIPVTKSYADLGYTDIEEAA